MEKQKVDNLKLPVAVYTDIPLHFIHPDKEPPRAEVCFHVNTEPSTGFVLRLQQSEVMEIFAVGPACPQRRAAGLAVHLVCANNVLTVELGVTLVNN